jgi:hypothetical protein
MKEGDGWPPHLPQRNFMIKVCIHKITKAMDMKVEM